MLSYGRKLVALFVYGMAFTAYAQDGVSDTAVSIGQTIGLTGPVAGSVKEMNEGRKLILPASISKAAFMDAKSNCGS